MHVPTLILIVAIETYIALLLAAFLLVIYAFKQRKLIRRQQNKLRELIDTINAAHAPTAAPGKTYQQQIGEQVQITQERFALIAPRQDLDSLQHTDQPANQRIVALRYAFLRAEEKGIGEIPGSEGYWNVFREALEPLLQLAPEASDAGAADNEELELYKKRVENLEKFKSLFFDLEKRWNEAQANAQGYYNELYAMADGVADREQYEMLLDQYRNSYNDITHYINSTNSALSGAPVENKTINIIRQDPRAADEIMKLRNVAADQYRVINNLQRQLEIAVTAEEKEQAIKDLEQQLQRQIRFVQESDTCIQLLEEELNKAHEQIAEQAKLLDRDVELEEENQRIKETLHSFTQESKHLLEDIEHLEQENDQLKMNQEQHPTAEQSPANLQKVQDELTDLRKQYTELEEKYLELKFK